MSQIKTLLRQSSHYMLGRIIVMAIGFISFPVYARLLPVAEYGILNLAQKCMNFAIAVSKLGLQNAILRLHAEHSSSPESLRRLYTTISLSTLGSGIFCTLVCALLVWVQQFLWISREVGTALLVSCGLIITRTGLSPIYGLLRVEGRTVLFNVLDVVIRVSSLVFGLLLVLFWSRSAISLLSGLILGEVVALAVGGGFVAKHRLVMPGCFDTPLLRHSLTFALPLAGSELATTLLDSADRTLIQYYLGSEPLGYYAAACAMAGYLQEALQMPLNMALVPLYVKTWQTQGAEETSRLVSRIFDLFLMVACGITAIIFATSHYLIVIISSQKYAPVAPLLGPLVVGTFFFACSIFLSAGFILQKKTLVLARLVVTALVFKTVLNVLLLPPLGLWGAVLPNVIGFATMAGLSAWYSRDLLRIRLSWMNLLIYVVAAIAAALVGGIFCTSIMVLTLAVRCGITLAIYSVILWCFDDRIRDYGKQSVRVLLQRVGWAQM